MRFGYPSADKVSPRHAKWPPPPSAPEVPHDLHSTPEPGRMGRRPGHRVAAADQSSREILVEATAYLDSAPGVVPDTRTLSDQR